MVKERMDLLELLRKGGMDGDVDFLREALRVLVEGIMDAEVSSRIGAEYGERSPERVTQRNGYRSRAWDTRVGTMELHIPKLREGSYFPSLLEPRRRSERALLAVIQQAYVEGLSTRRVDDLVKALGCEGISKSQVSRICQELDVVVDGFMGRPLDGGPYPYLWLDALTQKVREDGRIVNVSVVVATAVNGEGKREDMTTFMVRIGSVNAPETIEAGGSFLVSAWSWANVVQAPTIRLSLVSADGLETELAEIPVSSTYFQEEVMVPGQTSRSLSEDSFLETKTAT